MRNEKKSRNKKRVAILGSTGSIGIQTMDVISKFPDNFEVVALTANKNLSLLLKQIKDFRPEYVSIGDEYQNKLLKELKSEGLGAVKVVDIKEILCRKDIDIVVMAISGFASLEPSIHSVLSKRIVALASKEAILCASDIIKDNAKKSGAKIIPLDSEHSSLFRLLQKIDKESVKRVYITASGGPFLRKSKEEIEKATLAEALKHPVWSMGKKITIDSATLMNKSFEIIETSYLFDLPPTKISVIIHPEAFFHGLVETYDGGIYAFAHTPDMRIPIFYALFFGEAEAREIPYKTNTISQGLRLTFEEPDKDRFPSYTLGYKVLELAGTAPSTLVVSDEVAAQNFLEGKIRLVDIYTVVSETLKNAKIYPLTLENIKKAGQEAEYIAKDIIKHL